MKDILKRELIGLAITIVDSKNHDNIGLQGKIIDETKQTILIKTKNGKKRLMKNNITFTLSYGGKTLKIIGSAFDGKPEERIKRK